MGIRPLNLIAQDILADPALKGNARVWSKPYLDALLTCKDATGYYGQDSVDSLVRYALGNLSSYRGVDAKRHKNDLRRHVGMKVVK